MKAYLLPLLLLTSCYTGAKVTRVGQPLEAIGLTFDAIPTLVSGALAVNSLDKPDTLEFKLSLSTFLTFAIVDLIAYGIDE